MLANCSVFQVWIELCSLHSTGRLNIKVCVISLYKGRIYENHLQVLWIRGICNATNTYSWYRFKDENTGENTPISGSNKECKKKVTIPYRHYTISPCPHKYMPVTNNAKQEHILLCLVLCQVNYEPPLNSSLYHFSNVTYKS